MTTENKTTESVLLKWATAMYVQRKLALLALKNHNIAHDWKGSARELISVIGIIQYGFMFGWRSLKVVKNPRTIAKYEKHIGHKVTDLFPEYSTLSSKHKGLTEAEEKGYWQYVRHEITNDHAPMRDIIN